MPDEQSVVLEYRSIDAAQRSWFAFARLVFQGPLVGACVGFAQASSAIILARLNDKYYFYFHGSSVMLYIVLGFGGGLVGIPYGLILYAYERLRRRRILLGWLICMLAGLGSIAEVAARTNHFFAPPSWLFFAPQLFAVVLGVLLPLVTVSRVD